VNSGDLNSGDRNSGDRNSGYLNSGDLNSGDRNSGVFCNKQRKDAILFFNKESSWTWDDWFNSRQYRILQLQLTTWIDFSDMSDEEKKANPNAHITDGYLKVYEYKEAWANLWAKLSDEEKQSIKELPNYDSDVFEFITGIKY